MYIRPAGRRLSEYESVICHVQPDFGQYDIGDWFVRSPHGHGVFEAQSTRLQHPDWFQYRDPSATWQRPYTRQQGEEERAIEREVTAARDAGAFAEILPEWHRVLAGVYETWACAELGLFHALARSVRPALSDAISMALLFSAVDRLRHQQDIALLALDLEAELVGYPVGMGVTTWIQDEAFQPTREIVERLMVTGDWVEAAFVIACIFDQLVTDLVTDRFLRRQAPIHGDIVTPHILLSAQRARHRQIAAVEALVQMSLSEAGADAPPVPYKHNRAVFQGWVDDWAPPIVEAVSALGPIFDLTAKKSGDATRAVMHVMLSCDRSLTRFGLNFPVGAR
jgi:methane monooxygenase component A beta chain/propane monooxygenase small subunit